MPASDFKISEVTVGRLKSGPKAYENERVEVTVQVPEGKTGAEAVAVARAFIAKQFGETPKEAEVLKAREVIAAHEAQVNL